MNLMTLCKLGSKHLRNAFAESIYLKGGYDCTRPTAVHAILTKRCNSKCRYCEYWRLENDDYGDEMSIEEWQKALLSLKDFIGSYFVEFSGGEPFVKKGFMDLLPFCDANGIRFGITTNGLALNERIAREVVSAKPFNINISVDAHMAEVHDYLRGVPGSWDRLTSGIKYLVREREAQNVRFPIIVKPTVNAKNFHLLPELVEWVQELGATTVNFQPMDRWTPETYDELSIEEERLGELEEVAGRLREMKRNGAPIMTSDFLLRLWSAHFREEKAPPEALPCRVGLRNCFIQPNGEIQMCWRFPSIGSLREQSAKKVWYSPKARQVRKGTVACQQLCLFTCLSHKTLKDKFQVALKLMKP